MDGIAHSVNEHWKGQCQAPFPVSATGCDNLIAVLNSMQRQTRAWKILTTAFAETFDLSTRATNARQFLEEAFGDTTNREFRRISEKREAIRKVEVKYLVPLALFIRIKEFYRGDLDVIKLVCEEVPYFVEEDLVHRIFRDTDVRTSCRAPDLYSDHWNCFLKGFNDLCRQLDKKRKAQDDDASIAIHARGSRDVVRRLPKKVLIDASSPADSAAPAPTPPPHLPTTPSSDTASASHYDRLRAGTTDADGSRTSPARLSEEDASVPLQADTWTSTASVGVRDMPFHGLNSISSNVPDSGPLYHMESRGRVHDQQASGLVLPRLIPCGPGPSLSEHGIPQSYRSSGSHRDGEHSAVGAHIRRPGPGRSHVTASAPMIQATETSPSARSLPSIGRVVGGGHASNMPGFPDHPPGGMSAHSQASAQSQGLVDPFDPCRTINVDPVFGHVQMFGRTSAFNRVSPPDLIPTTGAPTLQEASLDQAPNAHQQFFVPERKVKLPCNLEFLLDERTYLTYDPTLLAFSQIVSGVLQWVTQVRMYLPKVQIDGYIILHVASQEQQRVLTVMNAAGQITAGAHLFGDVLYPVVDTAFVYPPEEHGEYLICLSLKLDHILNLAEYCLKFPA